MKLFHGWTNFEKVWLAVFTIIQLILFFWWQQSAIDLICALSNMLCVVLVAKGRMENFFFGVIATALYAYISYQNKIFGEAMLSGLFYLPMQFIGLYFWLKHRAKNTQADTDVEVKNLSVNGWAIMLVVVGVCSFVYAELLAYLNAQQVHLDSFTVVICIIAQILMTMRYSEQWFLWVTSNILGIILWMNAGNYAMVMMTCASLFNALYGWYHWHQQAKKIQQIRISSS
ncbi:nicotinamide riboside transporter PnuC [Acinetobacter rathckeae]|uniref:nicotinamide riboside transporter PnuC n=1 Tax=Acinetobacter rathckeae TaxID=2605272 RepID=UPI0018A2E2B2|nr:nicotinamide riboside transporter PnuC [Acinetobacter rathckeae]MBF7688887.1 nicotinamide mononucleotide transporter [Acinetobacter rathckeae]MBF7696396.1 nicotinamide mononucleotide transporter [Acinetobacter rathckeae]